jgi:hypothetical protein
VVRLRPHVGAAPRRADRQPRPRRHGAVVAPAAAALAAERAPLRRPPGSQQEGDGGEVRRRADQPVAPVLRRPAAARRRGLARAPAQRPALPAPRPHRAAGQRVPAGRGGPDAPVLVRPDRPPAAGRPHRARGGPRQLPARPGEAPGGHLRRRHRRPQHPHRGPAPLRVRRRPAHQGGGLPGGPGRHRGRRGRGGRPDRAAAGRTAGQRPGPSGLAECHAQALATISSNPLVGAQPSSRPASRLSA